MTNSARTELIDPTLDPHPPDGRADDHRPGARPWAALLAIALVVGLAVVAFAWPAARLAPRDLPIGLAGPDAAVQQVERQLAEQQPGAFQVTRFAAAADLDDAIRSREVYGGLALAADGVSVRTATAASPVVAELLRGVGGRVSEATGAPLDPVDVVAAPAADPRGAAFGSSMLPLVLAGEIAALLVLLSVGPGLVQVLTLLAASGGAGAMVLLVTGTWLDVLPGGGWETWGALSLTVLAIAAAAAGLNALHGRPGLGLAAVLMIFVGNPFSGATSAPELLPTAAGTIGQLLPPGAGANLVRSVTSFDGAGAAGHLAVLLVWSVAGLLLTLLAARLPRPAGVHPVGPHPTSS